MSGLRSRTALSLKVALLCCCVDMGPLCAQTNTILEKEGGTLRGTVVNSVTHEPVGRALVYSPDNRFATLTDSAGHFEFKVPASEAETGQEQSNPLSGPGPVSTLRTGGTRRTISLMARKPGFLSNEYAQETQLSAGQKEVTLYLVPGALITGHVTLEGSDSPEKIQVEIYRRQIRNGNALWTSAGTFTTWSDGDFRFSELPPGDYKLFTHELMDRDPLTFDPQGQLYGYPPVYFPGARSFAAGSTIHLSAGATFEADLSPTRREYYPVEVGLTNAPVGAPVNVTVFAGGQEGPGYSLGYNPQEQKVQGSLPDGTYTIEVSSFGPAAGTGSVDIIVKGGVPGYQMTLVANTSIQVNVTEEFTSAQGSDESAQPGSFTGNLGRRGRDLRVRLEPAGEFEQYSGASLRRRIAPGDESMMLENVKPGRYWVRADSARGYVASIQCGETDLLHHPLVVPAGGTTEPIELTLRDDGAQVDGIIEDVSTAAASLSNRYAQLSQPTPHVLLIPLPDSPGQFRDVWASPDGTFSSKQVPPGDYQVLAFDPGQPGPEFSNKEAMRKYYSRGQEIQLVPGQNLHLRVHKISTSE